MRSKILSGRIAQCDSFSARSASVFITLVKIARREAVARLPDTWVDVKELEVKATVIQKPHDLVPIRIMAT